MVSQKVLDFGICLTLVAGFAVVAWAIARRIPEAVVRIVRIGRKRRSVPSSRVFFFRAWLYVCYRLGAIRWGVIRMGRNRAIQQVLIRFGIRRSIGVLSV